jgi:uncharacterized protein with GYD domain
MAKYLLKIKYDAEGIGGVMRDGGSARRAAADDIVKSVGGSVESYYFAFGDDDAYAICELPDNTAAATVAMTVTSTGRVSISTVALLTVAEMDAVAKANKLPYRPPGG